MKPFKHQLKSLKHAETTPVVFDCSDPGTGKTGVAIWVDQRLRTRRQIKKTLVLAPKSLLRSVWFNDFKKFAPATRVVVSTAGNHDKAFSQDADVYVTNIDAVKWLAKQPDSFFKHFDFLIVDESTAYKHATSQRSKAAARIARHFKFRRLMTGTPNSNSITDVWHQVFLLDAGKRLGKSFYGFRNAVCTPVQVGRNANAIQWEDKDGAEEAVFGMLTDIVVRHKFEDCVDIPENHQYEVKYELSPKQLKTYEQMREMAVAELQGMKHVTAINAAAVTTKLLQIASGAVYLDSSEYSLVDTGRYELILDLVEERKHSLVFFLWKHQRDLLVAEAEKRGISFALIDGQVKEDERNAIVQNYQAGAYRTLFAHPRSAGHGLTLTRGTATIWASPTYDLEIFKQGSKRQHRLGQTQKTETIVVLAQDTLDEHAYEVMQGKNIRMSNLLSLFETL
jgi:SNF2 family DNA or RNA helicase